MLSDKPYTRSIISLSKWSSTGIAQSDSGHLTNVERVQMSFPYFCNLINLDFINFIILICLYGISTGQAHLNKFHFYKPFNLKQSLLLLQGEYNMAFKSKLVLLKSMQLYKKSIFCKSHLDR